MLTFWDSNFQLGQNGSVQNVHFLFIAKFRSVRFVHFLADFLIFFSNEAENLATFRQHFGNISATIVR